MTGPYYQGVYAVDTIVTASYGSPGDCEFFDVTIDCQYLVPYVSGMSLELHVLNTPNFVTINGNQISVGSVLPIDQQNTSFVVDFDVAGSLEFAIIATGTPLQEGQEMPCWIEVIQTLAICSNAMQINWGESLVPCFVQPSVGIDQIDYSSIDINVNQRSLSLKSNQNGTISIFNLEGKNLLSNTVQSGLTEINLSNFTIGTYVVQFEGTKGAFSQKIFLP